MPRRGQRRGVWVWDGYTWVKKGERGCRKASVLLLFGILGTVGGTVAEIVRMCS